MMDLEEDPIMILSRLPPVVCVAVLALATACASSPAAPPEIEVEETPAGVAAVKVPGRLTGEGVECQALRADDGTLYTLLGDLKGFKTGDPVVVEGTPVQISFCMQGTTLQVRQITRKP
jgi:hypothetical protein